MRCNAGRPRPPPSMPDSQPQHAPWHTACPQVTALAVVEVYNLVLSDATLDLLMIRVCTGTWSTSSCKPFLKGLMKLKGTHGVDANRAGLILCAFGNVTQHGAANEGPCRLEVAGECETRKRTRK